MPRDVKVRQVMTTDVLTFLPDEPVQDAMRRLVDAAVDGAPVVDPDGGVVGMLSSGDLIVQESQLHFPTVIELFGGLIELPSAKRHFEEDLHKAVGASVGDVMDDEPVVVGPDDTLEQAATLMHDRELSRLPVVDGGRLVGIVARGDLLRAIVDDLQPD